jgi:hypothetical protein
MPFTPPTGSGILLCPTGVGFSTLSEDIFEIIQELVDAGYAELVEITPAVYEQWVSNAKEIEVRVDGFIIGMSGELEPVTVSATYQQGIAEGGFDSAVEFNTSDHPFPLLYFGESNYGLGLTYRPIIYGENTGLFDEFTYHDTAGYDTEGERPNLFYPRVFIRNDKFYWYKQLTFTSGDVTTNTLTETENVIVGTYEIYVGGEITEVTQTTTTRITERFY